MVTAVSLLPSSRQARFTRGNSGSESLRQWLGNPAPCTHLCASQSCTFSFSCCRWTRGVRRHLRRASVYLLNASCVCACVCGSISSSHQSSEVVSYDPLIEMETGASGGHVAGQHPTAHRARSWDCSWHGLPYQPLHLATPCYLLCILVLISHCRTHSRSFIKGRE